MSQFNGLPRIIVLIVLLLVLMLLFVAPPALSKAYPAMETFLGFSLNNEHGAPEGAFAKSGYGIAEAMP